MPELPEIETIRLGLSPVMVGQRFTHVQVNRAGLRRPFPANMAGRLQGAIVQNLWRRSKYLLADLSTDETLLLHLGMSGRLLISGLGGDDPAPASKHDHVIFTMGNGAHITFNDPRRFGVLDLWPSDKITAHPLLEDLGPEPLGNAFDQTYLARKLAKRKTPIKNALMDQNLVAGLGNIYACESLFRAHLAPDRPAGSLSEAEIAALLAAIRNVLDEAIAAGGSSLRDYRQANGELGYFQHSFRVYDREGLPCLTPGCSGIIRRFTQSGRSSYCCPICQH